MSTINETRPADALRAGDSQADERATAAKPLGGIAGWMDDRLGGAKGVSFLAKKVFPDHWSFMLGEIAMYSMIVCLLTGAFLTFWFVPSASQVVYDGSYVPLQGVTMSDAYRSTLGISFDIRGGLLMPADPPLGGPDLRRLGLRAHGSRVLHRRVPQTA